jgi:hypothetical protein
MTDNALEKIMEALQHTQLCAGCVARRTSLAVLRVDVVLRNLVRSAVAVLEADECRACAQTTSIYRVGGSPLD